MYLLVLLLAFSGCGISSTMDSVKRGMGNMEKVSDSLGKTSEALRAQTLSIALTEMMKPENLYFINLNSVSPSAIIPAAKIFAEKATADEIVGLAFLWITDINNGAVDAITEEQKQASDLFKLRRLVVLQAIAGMMPEDKTVEVLQTLRGEYPIAGYAMLALRHNFISSFILELGILTKPSLNKREYEAGVKAVRSLAFLEELPFKDKCVLKLFGFSSEDLNQTVTVESKASSLKERLDAIKKG